MVVDLHACFWHRALNLGLPEEGHGRWAMLESINILYESQQAFLVGILAEAGQANIQAGAALAPYQTAQSVPNRTATQTSEVIEAGGSAEALDGPLQPRETSSHM